MKYLLSVVVLLGYVLTATADTHFKGLKLDFNLSCKVFLKGKHTQTRDFKKGKNYVLPSSDKNTLNLFLISLNNAGTSVAYFKISRISGTGNLFMVLVPDGMMTKVFNDFASNINYSAFKSKYKNYELGDPGKVECKKANKNLF